MGKSTAVIQRYRVVPETEMVRVYIFVRFSVVKSTITHRCVPETGMGKNKNTETNTVCNNTSVCRRQGG